MSKDRRAMANSALDYGISATITGGYFLSTGYSGMAQSFSSDSTQCSYMLTLSSNTSGTTTVTLTDADGKVLLSHETSKSYILSSSVARSLSWQHLHPDSRRYQPEHHTDLHRQTRVASRMSTVYRSLSCNKQAVLSIRHIRPSRSCSCATRPPGSNKH